MYHPLPTTKARNLKAISLPHPTPPSCKSFLPLKSLSNQLRLPIPRHHTPSRHWFSEFWKVSLLTNLETEGKIAASFTSSLFSPLGRSSLFKCKPHHAISCPHTLGSLPKWGGKIPNKGELQAACPSPYLPNHACHWLLRLFSLTPTLLTSVDTSSSPTLGPSV